MKTAEQVKRWIDERALNTRGIAQNKSGQDKAGWIDDAEYLEEASRLMNGQAVYFLCQCGGIARKRSSIAEVPTCDKCDAPLHNPMTADAMVSYLGEQLKRVPRTCDGKLVLAGDLVFHPDFDHPLEVSKIGEDAAERFQDDNGYAFPLHLEFVAEGWYDEPDVGFHEHCSRLVNECWAIRTAMMASLDQKAVKP